MKILGGATFVYCGKCHDGFLQKVIAPGEVTLIPCECKVKQDSKYIHDRLLLESNITMLDHAGKSFGNYKEWMGQYNTQEKLVVYESIHKNFLTGTASKIAIPQQFHYWVTQENIKQTSNRYSVFFIMGKEEQSFYMNFIGYLLVKRLIPTRVISFDELIPMIMDPKKLDVAEIFKDHDVVLLTHMFSDDMIATLKIDFKYERICNFLYQVYNSEVVPIIFSESYINSIRNIDKTIKEKVIVQRVNSILNIILNKADTVIIRGLNEVN